MGSIKQHTMVIRQLSSFFAISHCRASQKSTLVDFGAAKVIEEQTLSYNDTPTGTDAYISPEVSRMH